jgi:hypothetical protein
MVIYASSSGTFRRIVNGKLFDIFWLISSSVNLRHFLLYVGGILFLVQYDWM